MSLLEARELSREFGGVHAVEALSFAIEPGRVHGIIGPNGAGKTTLLNLLTGIYETSAGRIAFNGADITRWPAHVCAAAGIARTFQTPQVFQNMSALENVMVGAHRHAPAGLARALLRLPGFTAGERALREQAAAQMAFVGIGEHVGAGAGSMSYGTMKRLEIARALAAQPKLLLMDEPAAGLNPTETAQIDALIRRIAKRGVTVVLVEHNMRLVMELCDHILVLDGGRWLAEGSAREVRENPRVIEAYLGAVQA